jgi:hypothetical protein
MQVTYKAILYIPVVSGYDVLVHGEDGLCVDPHPRHLHNFLVYYYYNKFCGPQGTSRNHQPSAISQQPFQENHLFERKNAEC